MRTDPPLTTLPDCSLSVGARSGRLVCHAGHESERQAGHQRQREVEHQDAGVRRRVDRDGRLAVDEQTKQQRRAPGRQQQAQGGAATGEHQALDDELPHDAVARAAQRQANRHLPLTRDAARQHQARDVRTGDQQHADDNRHQRPERLGQVGARPGVPLCGRHDLD